MHKKIYLINFYFFFCARVNCKSSDPHTHTQLWINWGIKELYQYLCKNESLLTSVSCTNIAANIQYCLTIMNFIIRIWQAGLVKRNCVKWVAFIKQTKKNGTSQQWTLLLSSCMLCNWERLINGRDKFMVGFFEGFFCGWNGLVIWCD